MNAVAMDMLNVLGGVVTGSAPVMSSEASGFAEMLAVAGQGVGSGPTVTADPPMIVETPETPQFVNDVHLFDKPKAQSLDRDHDIVPPSLVLEGAAFIDIAPPERDHHSSVAQAPTVELAKSEATLAQASTAPFSLAAILPAVVRTEVGAEPTVAEPASVVRFRARAAKADVPLDAPTPKVTEPTATPIAAAVAPPMPDTARLVTVQAEPVAPPVTDSRAPAATPTPTSERALPTLVERMVAFTPAVIDAARDLSQLGDGRAMRFNVHPDVLGPVAVTIERTDVGQNLRLGVETSAAVQAVRQAEPAFNDARGGNPFVNVTVDMTASDQRGRPPRAAPPGRHNNLAFPDDSGTAPAPAGRYA